jgi:hypothetical protein
MSLSVIGRECRDNENAKNLKTQYTTVKNVSSQASWAIKESDY